MNEQSTKYNTVLVHDLNEKVATLEAASGCQQEQVEELQGIYEYQLSINDDLNEKIGELEKQIQTMEQAKQVQLEESQHVTEARQRTRKGEAASSGHQETQADDVAKEKAPDTAQGQPQPISVLNWQDGEDAKAGD